VLRFEKYAIALVFIAIALFLLLFFLVVVVVTVDIFDSLSSCLLLNRFWKAVVVFNFEFFVSVSKPTYAVRRIKSLTLENGLCGFVFRRPELELELWNHEEFQHHLWSCSLPFATGVFLSLSLSLSLLIHLSLHSLFLCLFGVFSSVLFFLYQLLVCVD